jgi:hypothetical protein
MVQVPNPQPWRFAQPPSSHSLTLGLPRSSARWERRRTTKIQHIRHCLLQLLPSSPAGLPMLREDSNPRCFFVASQQSVRIKNAVPLPPLRGELFIQPPAQKSASLVCATATRNEVPWVLPPATIPTEPVPTSLGEHRAPFVPCRIECASPAAFWAP